MHMSDALLSPSAGAALWAGSMGAIALSAKKLADNADEKKVPLMGVMGAFIFAAQMINFTIPGTGSSGHLGGGMLLSILLGPYAAFIVMSSVLSVQALFFADGGLLALGSNIWNLGVYPCFVAYPLIYRPLAGTGSSPKRSALAAVMSAVAALQLGALSVVLQTTLSGRSELPFNAFIVLMLPVHLVIGLIEGAVTAGIISFVSTQRPDAIEGADPSRTDDSDARVRNILTVFLLAAVFTGGVMSWFASSNPDGLKRSIEKISGRSDLPEHKSGIALSMKTIQEKTAFLPDYNFRKAEEQTGAAEHVKEAWPAVEPGRSVSGIIGSCMVLSGILIVGVLIRVFKRKTS